MKINHEKSKKMFGCIKNCLHLQTNNLIQDRLFLHFYY